MFHINVLPPNYLQSTVYLKHTKQHSSTPNNLWYKHRPHNIAKHAQLTLQI